MLTGPRDGRSANFPNGTQSVVGLQSWSHSPLSIFQAMQNHCMKKLNESRWFDGEAILQFDLTPPATYAACSWVSPLVRPSSLSPPSLPPSPGPYSRRLLLSQSAGQAVLSPLPPSLPRAVLTPPAPESVCWSGRPPSLPPSPGPYSRRLLLSQSAGQAVLSPLPPSLPSPGPYSRRLLLSQSAGQAVLSPLPPSLPPSLPRAVLTPPAPESVRWSGRPPGSLARSSPAGAGSAPAAGGPGAPAGGSAGARGLPGAARPLPGAQLAPPAAGRAGQGPDPTPPRQTDMPLLTTPLDTVDRGGHCYWHSYVTAELRANEHKRKVTDEPLTGRWQLTSMQTGTSTNQKTPPHVLHLVPSAPCQKLTRNSRHRHNNRTTTIHSVQATQKKIFRKFWDLLWSRWNVISYRNIRAG